VSSPFEVSWHRTSASSALGTVASGAPGALLASISVGGDWYVLPGTVSAPLPHRFERPADSVTFLCFRRPTGSPTELPVAVLGAGAGAVASGRGGGAA
jgi:hypothetical protein